MEKPILVKNDPWLEPYSQKIADRQQQAILKEKNLLGSIKSLKEFSSGHLYFGLHREKDHWIFREWAPNATNMFLIGDHSGWKEHPEFALTKKDHGTWEIQIPLKRLNHGDLYRLSVHWNNGEGNRIPAWANRVVQDDKTLIFNAQVWAPEKGYSWKSDWINTRQKPPIIYEAHVGMASEEGRLATYEEFRLHALPRIIRGGYNTIQLMAIQEHPYYGSFGYHVSSLFAASSLYMTISSKFLARRM